MGNVTTTSVNASIGYAGWDPGTGFDIGDILVNASGTYSDHVIKDGNRLGVKSLERSEAFEGILRPMVHQDCPNLPKDSYERYV